MSELSPENKLVKDFLDASGVEYRLEVLPVSAKTADSAAMALKCSVAQIAKSILFMTMDKAEVVLVVTSGVNRVNQEIISSHFGKDLKLASPEIVFEKTGFRVGGVSPVAHKTKIVIYIDQDLAQYKSVWAAAGTPESVFNISYDDLVKVTGGEVIKVS